MSIKVLLIQKSFSNYRKGIFDLLANSYDFTLLHAKENNGIKQNIENYSKIVNSIRYCKKSTCVFLNIIPDLIRVKPDVVIHEFSPSILSIYFLFLLRPLMRFKIILWGHGFNRSKPLNTKSIIFLIRKYLIKKADAIIFYGEQNKTIINELIPSGKYFVANNSLDTDLLNRIYSELKQHGKIMIKDELGIKARYNIVYVGRVLESKMLSDYYIDIINKLNNEVKDISFIIIGDGSALENFKNKVYKNNIHNVIFKGAIFDEILVGKYLYISDIMLMPGYVGLAVNHSLAFRIPIATFRQGDKGPYHSPEIEYVKNNKTGFLLTPFNTAEVSDAIKNYLFNKGLQENMRKEIEKCIDESCNINKMKKGFDNAIKYCLNEK